MTSSLEAVCVIETSSIARGFVVLDALVKRAPVVVKTARAVSPGKFLLVFGGDVDSVVESRAAALEKAGSDLIDELFLPGAHPALLSAIDQAITPHHGEAVGIVEMATVASTVHAADVALKAVDVAVLRMHLALGIGGKGYFTIAGGVGDVAAALDAVKDAVSVERVVGVELIAQPHAEVRGFMS
jgi:microcompartment protein CcmL/EutN